MSTSVIHRTGSRAALAKSQVRNPVHFKPCASGELDPFFLIVRRWGVPNEGWYTLVSSCRLIFRQTPCFQPVEITFQHACRMPNTVVGKYAKSCSIQWYPMPVQLQVASEHEHWPSSANHTSGMRRVSNSALTFRCFIRIHANWAIHIDLALRAMVTMATGYPGPVSMLRKPEHHGTQQPETIWISGFGHLHPSQQVQVCVYRYTYIYIYVYLLFMYKYI